MADVYESLRVPTIILPDKGRRNQSSSPDDPEYTRVISCRQCPVLAMGNASQGHQLLVSSYLRESSLGVQVLCGCVTLYTWIRVYAVPGDAY